jgi:hypothetical protein
LIPDTLPDFRLSTLSAPQISYLSIPATYPARTPEKT